MHIYLSNISLAGREKVSSSIFVKASRLIFPPERKSFELSPHENLYWGVCTRALTEERGDGSGNLAKSRVSTLGGERNDTP